MILKISFYRLFIIYTFAFLFNSINTFGCSSFVLQDEKSIVLGKNLDWFSKLTYLTVNKRNIQKTSFLTIDKSNKLTWTSKYGSLTFNPNGVGFPSGGMNEAGLVIEESWLGETDYPQLDNRPEIDEIQWIQYQLDNCGTVEEVIKTDSMLRIKQYTGKSHYFICDKNGMAATVEFIKGEMVYSIIPPSGVQVLTNNKYTESLDYLSLFKGFGGKNEFENTPKSLDRFAWATKCINEYETRMFNSIDKYAFNILNEISQKSTTRSVVYNITDMEILFTSKSNKNVRTISMRDFDFSCDTPTKILDVNIEEKGNLNKYFIDYSEKKNELLLKRVFRDWHKNNFCTHLTEKDMIKMIKYPNLFDCKQDKIGY